MRRIMGWWAACVVVGLVAIAARADDKVPLDKLPKPVVEALKARFPGAELKGAEKEGEGDKTVYDVSLTHKGQNYEASVTPDGKITTFEREIAAKDLPKPVTKTLEEKYPKATYKAVEEVYKVQGKEEKLECYEIAVVTADQKKVEVLVAPDGKIIKGGPEGAPPKPPAAEKIALDKVPAKIMAAVQGRFPGAELSKVEKEIENNEVVFDVELKQNGRKYEMDIKEDGTIIEIEKEVFAKDVPAAVSKAIEAKYPKSTVKEVMEVNKVKGKEETPDHYEVTLETADKKSLEVEVSLDGKTVKGGAAEGEKN